MTAADLVVSRAGASTLAELTILGRPMVLVPLPTAADDHQRKNAATLAAGRRRRGDRRTGSQWRSVGGHGDGPGRGRGPAAADGARRPRRWPGPMRRRASSTASSSWRAAGNGVLGRTRHVHFVGVGGIGMSGIAELLANLGYTVSGSDQRRSETTDRLAALGVSVREGHAAAHVGDADVVVVSSAVRADNPEVLEARGRAIPVIPRAEMLAELMRLRSGIAVAGAHGKTSTTSMIALALERAGLDPTAVIGGRLRAFGSNARLGRGEYMVVEADESDRSFLKLSPTIAVVTNIDREHMEAYGGFEDLQQAFVDFANKVPFYGAVIACADDAELARLLPRMARRVITYGCAAEHAEIAAVDVRLSGFGSTCTVVRRSPHPQPGETPAAETLGTLRLQVPGRHSVLNALAAVGVGLELAVPFAVLAAALADFQGAERRFERRGVVHGITVIDDYGHHPDRDRRGAGCGAGGRAGPRDRRLPAAPLLAHRPAHARVRRGAGRGRRSGAHRHLRRRRRRRSPASTSRRWPRPPIAAVIARCRWCARSTGWRRRWRRWPLPAIS